MLPTLRQLQYLRLLALHRSFSRAAEAAFVTQPTLSAGLQELEKILGVQLVDRARSGVILTAAGEEALHRGDAILAQVEDLVQAVRGAGQPLAGRFRLGVIPTVAPFLLPKALPILRSQFPSLRLFLREDLTHRLIAQVKSGALDGALMARPYDLTGLDWAHVMDDDLLAAAPADHPLARSARIDPAALAGRELILLEDGHCLRDHAMAACGLEPFRGDDGGAFAATSLPTLMQMVGSGLGCSFLPAMAAGLADSASVAVRPLTTESAQRQIVVAWRSGSSRAREGQLLAETLAAA